MFFSASDSSDRLTLKAQLDADPKPLVACYCAQWCRSCEAYYRLFKALSEQYPELIFLWIDIEDAPELLEDLDPENFPTNLLQRPDGSNVFFGSMLPHIAHLERLIQTFLQEDNRRSVPGPSAIRSLLGC